MRGRENSIINCPRDFRSIINKVDSGKDVVVESNFSLYEGLVSESSRIRMRRF